MFISVTAEIRISVSPPGSIKAALEVFSHQMIEQFCSVGVLGRAVEKKRVSIRCWNPRDYARDKHKTVDDRPYGGGPGMLMKVQPLADAITAAKDVAGQDAKVIYLSPQGKVLKQQTVCQLAEENKDVIIIAGRYEGIDERLIERFVDEEWSIGDYVLSGGEVAAMVVIDATTRMMPDVLGDAESAQQDSFMRGILDCPHYTRPEVVNGIEVPKVLLSGDHEAISQWRLKQALGKTWSSRPDLLDDLDLDKNQTQLLDEFKKDSQQVE